MDITYITLDATKLQTKEELHEFLKKALDLPDYYGENLDALHDCLTELSGREVAFEAINTENASEYFIKAMKCITDSMEENECIAIVDTVDEIVLDGITEEELLKMDGVSLEEIAKYFDKK